MNPQGFPCGYKRTSSAKVVAKVYKKLNVPIPQNMKTRLGINNNKTSRFLHIYDNPTYTKGLFDFLQDFRIVLGKAGGEVRSKFFKMTAGTPEGRIGAKHLSVRENNNNSSKNRKYKDLYREGVEFLLGAGGAEKFIKKHPAKIKNLSVNPPPADELYINGAQALRMPKTLLHNHLRRLRKMDIPATASKAEIVHGIRMSVLGGPYNMTNRTSNQSLSAVINRNRASKRVEKGTKSGPKMVAERVPLYMENGKLVVGKRVASTFTLPELKSVATSFGVTGISTLTKDQLVTNLTGEVRRRREKRSRNLVAAAKSRSEAQRNAIAKARAKRVITKARKFVASRKALRSDYDEYLRDMGMMFKGKPLMGSIFGHDGFMIASDIYNTNTIKKQLYAALDTSFRQGVVTPLSFEPSRSGGTKKVVTDLKKDIQAKLVAKVKSEWLKTRPNAVRNYATTKRGKRNVLPTFKEVIGFSNRLNKKTNK